MLGTPESLLYYFRFGFVAKYKRYNCCDVMIKYLKVQQLQKLLKLFNTSATYNIINPQIELKNTRRFRRNPFHD